MWSGDVFGMKCCFGFGGKVGANSWIYAQNTGYFSVFATNRDFFFMSCWNKKTDLRLKPGGSEGGVGTCEEMLFWVWRKGGSTWGKYMHEILDLITSLQKIANVIHTFDTMREKGQGYRKLGSRTVNHIRKLFFDECTLVTYMNLSPFCRSFS